MGTKKLVCAKCEVIFELRVAEYNRQTRKGRNTFYCSRSCGAEAGNAQRRKPVVTKVCPECGTPFRTSTARKKNRTYCGQSCASKGSMTEARRIASRKSKNLRHDIEIIALGLRSREGWKYEELRKYLEHMNEEHNFEHVVGAGIFDLALPGKKLLVEFDGKYHARKEQVSRDAQKEAQALENGWKLVRIKTDVGIIPASVLYAII